MGELRFVGTIGNLAVRRDDDGGIHLRGYAGIPFTPVAKPVWTCTLTPSQGDAFIGLLKAAREGVERPHQVSHLLKLSGTADDGTEFYVDPDKKEDQ